MNRFDNNVEICDYGKNYVLIGELDIYLVVGDEWYGELRQLILLS